MGTGVESKREFEGTFGALVAGGLNGRSLGREVAADVARSGAEFLLTTFASEGEARREDGALLNFPSCISVLIDADRVGLRSLVTVWL